MTPRVLGALKPRLQRLWRSPFSSTPSSCARSSEGVFINALVEPFLENYDRDMPMRGGTAAKYGIRYEDRWCAYCALRVLAEVALAIYIEPPGPD
jgi:hypothetical protein